jgi:hypothetical protein
VPKSSGFVSGMLQLWQNGPRVSVAVMGIPLGCGEYAAP